MGRLSFTSTWVNFTPHPTSSNETQPRSPPASSSASWRSIARADAIANCSSFLTDRWNSVGTCSTGLPAMHLTIGPRGHSMSQDGDRHASLRDRTGDADGLRLRSLEPPPGPLGEPGHEHLQLQGGEREADAPAGTAPERHERVGHRVRRARCPAGRVEAVGPLPDLAVTTGHVRAVEDHRAPRDVVAHDLAVRDGAAAGDEAGRPQAEHLAHDAVDGRQAAEVVDGRRPVAEHAVDLLAQGAHDLGMTAELVDHP